jgi:hypothetical protein
MKFNHYFESLNWGTKFNHYFKLLSLAIGFNINLGHWV